MKLGRHDLISVSEVRTTTKVGREFPRDPRAHKKRNKSLFNPASGNDDDNDDDSNPYVSFKSRIGPTRLHNEDLKKLVFFSHRLKKFPHQKLHLVF